MTPEHIEAFAQEWYNAWNAHDLDAILSHYNEAIVFSSPFAQKLTGDATGTVRGLTQLRVYFEKALQAYPDLHFVPIATAIGAQSVALIYRSVNNLLAVETMTWDEKGKIERVWAHYTEHESPL